MMSNFDYNSIKNIKLFHSEMDIDDGITELPMKVVKNESTLDIAKFYEIFKRA